MDLVKVQSSRYQVIPVYDKETLLVPKNPTTSKSQPVLFLFVYLFKSYLVIQDNSKLAGNSKK